jgi:electron transfer flavoprotein alpha subunit
MSNILVFVETRQGKIRKSSLEAVTLAKKIGSKAVALVIDADADKVAGELKEYGPDAIYTVKGIKNYSPDAYREALAAAIEKCGAKIVLASQTAMATDFIPAAAAKLNAGMVTDALEVKIDGGKVVTRKPIYAGKVLADYAINSEIAFVTIRPNVYPAEAAASSPAVEELAVNIGAPKAEAKETKSASDELDISEADVIISGGRGVKGPEGFEPLKELATLLGGAVGASRSAVDSEWINHQHQVGQTGKTVSPVLYVACGISGKIQHLAGMASSKYIVAINKDAEAPIFDIADFGIVGDLFQVLPELTKKVKEVKG